MKQIFFLSFVIFVYVFRGQAQTQTNSSFSWIADIPVNQDPDWINRASVTDGEREARLILIKANSLGQDPVMPQHLVAQGLSFEYLNQDFFGEFIPEEQGQYAKGVHGIKAGTYLIYNNKNNIYRYGNCLNAYARLWKMNKTEVKKPGFREKTKLRSRGSVNGNVRSSSTTQITQEVTTTPVTTLKKVIDWGKVAVVAAAVAVGGTVIWLIRKSSGENVEPTVPHHTAGGGGSNTTPETVPHKTTR